MKDVNLVYPQRTR